MAFKALNHTLRPEGFVPSALVVGKYPQTSAFRIENLPRSGLAERAEIAEEARKEMSSQMASVRFRCALRNRITESAQSIYKPGNLVLICHEKFLASRIGE